MARGPDLKILITGGNGFIGRKLRYALDSRGHRVVSAVREVAGEGDVAIGDIGPKTAWLRALEGCEAVVHLAARAHILRDSVGDAHRLYHPVNCLATLNLARQAEISGVKRFVFISSIGVNGNRTELNAFTEEDTPNPVGHYAISKYEAEVGLIEIAEKTDMEITILRPPLVYGPGGRGNFQRLLWIVRRGLPLPLGAIRNRRSFVALENVIDCITLCVERTRSPRAANELFLISDGEDVSTTELVRKIADSFSVRARLVSIPERWLWAAARLLRQDRIADQLLGSLVIDSSKVRAVLGWKPTITMEAQLREVAKYDSPV